jgi:hypothetical protein
MPKKILPVQQAMCKTCPFRHGSKYHYLAPGLTQSALSEDSRICHSTGTNAIHRRTGKPERICRGARDIQLQLFTALGLLKKPTDAAWAAKCKELNLK